MSKTRIEGGLPALVLPVCIVGSEIDDRINYCTVAWFTMIDDEPPTIGVVMAKKRRTKDGIVMNGEFSINIPSVGMMDRTDACGLRSGYDLDKSQMFKSFYGTLDRAPMISDSPLSMECRLTRVVEFEGVDMVVGEIVAVHVDEDLLDDKRIDLKKLNPLLYGMTQRSYFELGGPVGKAFEAGLKVIDPN